MVRNIIGLLVEIGVGDKFENWIVEFLVGKDCSFVVVIVKFNGFYLVDVIYLDIYNIFKYFLGLLFFVEN